jgi:hypothetical protein
MDSVELMLRMELAKTLKLLRKQQLAEFDTPMMRCMASGI